MPLITDPTEQIMSQITTLQNEVRDMLKTTLQINNDLQDHNNMIGTLAKNIQSLVRVIELEGVRISALESEVENLKSKVNAIEIEMKADPLPPETVAFSNCMRDPHDLIGEEFPDTPLAEQLDEHNPDNL